MRVARIIHNHFDEVLHVDKSELAFPAKDHDIWKFAKDNDFIIVTNDEDFLNLLLSKGFPPNIVLLRMGNQKTLTLANTLIKHKKEILELQNNKTTGVLQIF